jgi:hypothetical protein
MINKTATITIPKLIFVLFNKNENVVASFSLSLGTVYFNIKR